MRNEFKRFLADERGGGALEYALVSTLATFASVAGILVLQRNEADFISTLRRKVTEAVDLLNSSVR